MKKKPTMVLFWGDTGKPLTYHDRKSLEFNATVVSVTPEGIVLELKNRRVVIYGITDPAAPPIPPPREGTA